MHHKPKDEILLEIANLQKPLAGRRVVSWLLFICFMGGFLVLPTLGIIWPSAFSQISFVRYFAESTNVYSKASKSSTSQAVDRFNLDVSWSSGTLSTAHQTLNNQCHACHSKPFVRVQNQDCLACHKGIANHTSQGIMNVTVLHQTRCASCHREHNGTFGLLEQNKQFGVECIECHENIKDVFPDTKTENVKDFTSDHPAFRIQVNIDDAVTKLARIRQGTTSQLTEKTSLKFPHDVHLAVGGVNSPEGKIKMTCNNCHKLDGAGVSFRPVTMKENCQHCHALRFDLAVPNREVPHGPVDQVLSTLREFYSYVGISGIPLEPSVNTGTISTIRPGQQPNIGSFVRTAGDVRSRAIASATELFEKTSCTVCHEVTRSSEQGKSGMPDQDMPQWKITPIPARHEWMPKAVFNHREHLLTQCTECHAAAKSTLATDVLMPTINQCRTCHVAKESAPNKIISDCGLCHEFHIPSHFTSAGAPLPMVYGANP